MENVLKGAAIAIVIAATATIVVGLGCVAFVFIEQTANLGVC